MKVTIWAKMGYLEKLVKIANSRKLLTKFQMIWQRVPFETGDNGVFGENGKSGEQSPNY